MFKKFVLTFAFSLIIPLLYLSAGSTLQAEELSPKQTISNTLSEILAVVEEYPGKNNSKNRFNKLRAIIEPRFDFKEMSKRSLGSNWSTITEEQRLEFIRLFSELLANTYLSRIETVKKGMVKIDSEKTYPASSSKSMPSALVKTSVTHKGDIFPLDYKLVKRSTGWQAYDVIIENIGLVSNYRNEFSGILRKEGFNGLIQLLKTKQKENIIK
jgi:phospholipid transport system substrate-binding protein